MNRRHFLATSSFAIIGAALKELPRSAYGGQPPPPATTKFLDLRRGVGIFTGQGGTIGWLATPDGVLVVDSQSPAMAQVCLDGLRQKSPHPIDVLINTHHHGDHTGGNKTFRPAVKTIVAHANAALWQKKTAEAAKTEANQAYPDKTFTTSWKTTIGNENVSAKYYGPAHTSGDVIVVFEKANIVHMGDLMFHRMYPFIDRPAGASIANWIKTLGRVSAEHSADTLYVFGHARSGLEVTGYKTDLARFRDCLSAVLEYTRTQMKAGKSKDEIAKTPVLSGFEDYPSGSGFLSLSGVLSTAYDELNVK
jgi:glyoxylase-like metal-dependent hydrolase (beta-lactamase superfamily II)